eukprot:Platyproteum_vivax@DN3905_c0_g1_i1.p1
MAATGSHIQKMDYHNLSIWWFNFTTVLNLNWFRPLICLSNVVDNETKCLIQENFWHDLSQSFAATINPFRLTDRDPGRVKRKLWHFKAGFAFPMKLTMSFQKSLCARFSKFFGMTFPNPSQPPSTPFGSLIGTQVVLKENYGILKLDLPFQ